MAHSALPRLSRILQWLCLGWMIGLPVLVLGYIVMLPKTPDVINNLTGFMPASESGAVHIWSALIVGLLPLVVLVWTLFQMHKLFVTFASGTVLTLHVAARIRRIGQGFLVLALVPFIVKPVQSILLSWAAGTGQREISVAVSSDMVGFALVSGLLIVIGWAMGQAAEVAAENRSFV